MTNAKNALIDQLIVSGSNFFVVMLAARFLEQSGVARYAYIFALFMLSYMFANAWIYQNVMANKQSFLAEQDGVNNYAVMNIVLIVITIPLSILIYALFMPDISPSTWIEALLASAFIAVNQLIDFERRVRYFVIHSEEYSSKIISAVGFLPRLFALFVFKPNTIAHFLLILVLFSLPGALFAVKRLASCQFSKFFLHFMRQQIHDGKWMTINIPVNWAWGQAPVFIIGTVLGLHAAGIYAAVRSIVNIANVIMEMIPTYFASRLSVLFNNDNFALYVKHLSIAVWAGIGIWALVVAATSVIGSQLLALVLGAIYSKYLILFNLLWTFNLLVYLIRIQSLHLRFIEKTHIVPFAHLIGVSVLMGTFYLYLYKFDIVGMAWSMLAGGIVILFLHMLVIVSKQNSLIEGRIK